MTEWLTVVAVVAGLAGIGSATWSARSESLRGRRLLVGLGGIAAVSLVGAAAMSRRDFDYFGLIHLGYLVGVVSVPMLGLALLAVPGSRPRPRVEFVACVMLLFPVPLGLYMTHVEPYRLRTDPVDVAFDPSWMALRQTGSGFEWG